MEHVPVMPHEVTKYLNIQTNGVYIDCTFGGGGHSKSILSMLSPNGRLISIDWDKETIRDNGPKFSDYENFTLICGNFADLSNIVEKLKIVKIDGILFDLGFSSGQIGDRKRGFSFLGEAPLDMRYNEDNPLTAQILLNNYPQDYLEDILKNYAQERFFKSIANGIIKYRKEKKIETTRELVEIIKRTTPGWYHHRRIHLATKTFQALRMAVNGEIKNIENGIKSAINLISSGGRIAVISFHSMEHRCVKNIFREAKQNNLVIPVVKKSVIPSESEMIANPRSRSSQLRIVEKV